MTSGQKSLQQAFLGVRDLLMASKPAYNTYALITCLLDWTTAVSFIFCYHLPQGKLLRYTRQFLLEAVGPTPNIYLCTKIVERNWLRSDMLMQPSNPFWLLG